MKIIKGMGNITCDRERREALKLWNALYNDNMEDLARHNFDESTAEVYFNPSSGYVFLSDDDYNTVMVDDEGTLYLFISAPYEGLEGSFEDLMSEYDNMHQEDKEYMQQIATEELKEKYPVLKVEE